MDCREDRPVTSVSDFLSFRALTRPRLDVFWEPTPCDVAGEMLRLADVQRNDVVYDLGCGDGRIVIMAAKKTGARCVGVDLDPQRIADSSVNATREGVAHLVTFVNGDLFETDISEATVLTLFLFPDVNLRLRPKVLGEMKPGSRVVSYCHSMEAWEPDHTETTRRNHIYYWVVPANFSGRWKGGIETVDGWASVHLEVRQQFQRLSGYITFEGCRLGFEKSVVKGNTMTFAAVPTPHDVPVNEVIGNPAPEGLTRVKTPLAEVKGTIKGDRMIGTIRTADSTATRRWTATRNPSTRLPLAT